MHQRKPPKSSKMKMELDKISNLPSDVIEKILSHLPIREAVRTSVLSSKWRHKSAMLPYLVFDYQCVSTQKHKTIADIVDHILLGHIGPIHKFKLSHPDALDYSDIDRWILHLSRNTIKEFTLDIWEDHPRYKMPSCFFSCQDMIHLELFKCLLNPPSTFKGFRSLKSLHIDNVTLAQDVFENLVVCCPLLEILNLINCDGFTDLKIDAPSLRRVYIEGEFEDINLVNTLNLAHVYIDLDVIADEIQVLESCGNLIKFFDRLPCIQMLKIESNFLKYLATGALPEKLPKPCLYLNFLSIYVHFDNLEEILTTICLLRSSPALQELEIRAYPKIRMYQLFLGEVNSWLDDNQNCPFTQLRFVKIFGITGVEAELEFITFLLLSSPMLETMTIKPAYGNICYSDKDLLKKLVRYKRASANAEIIYLES